MTKIQERVMQLMREIDQVCVRNDLPYALYGRTAGCAIKNGRFTTDCYQFRIMMQAGDIITLKEKLTAEKIPERAFEDFSNNPDLQYNYVRYVDTKTTVFDKNNPVSYRMPGAAVTIIPLYVQQISKLCEVLETGFIYMNGGRVHDESDRSKSAKRVGNCIRLTKMTMKVFGKKWAADKIYQSLLREKGKENKTSLIIRGDADTQFPDLRRKISAGYLLKTKRIPFYGMDLPVPEKSEDFLKKLYGNDWKEIAETPYQTTNSMNVIWDNYVPFRDYLAEMEKEGIDYYQILEEERQIRNYHKNTYEPWEKKAFRYLYYGKRSVKRIDLYCYYRGKMQDLKKAEKAGDIKQIRTIMKKYLRTVDRYRNLGLEFYINDELHHYAQLVWAKTKGKSGYGREIYSQTPEAYKEKDMEEYLKEYI